MEVIIIKLIDSFANRLKYALTIKNIRPIDLVSATKISKANISSYMAGKYEPKTAGLSLIAKALDVDPVWLMGYDVPMKIDKSFEKVELSKDTAVVLVYGTIPAGIPLECIEDIIGIEEISSDWLKGGKEYFGLKIKGDSMSPEYLENDIIILEKVPDCESGNDCVVTINGNDGTFKRVFKNENSIILQPLNNSYQPLIYTNEQIENLPVKIIGKVVQLRRNK